MRDMKNLFTLDVNTSTHTHTMIQIMLLSSSDNTHRSGYSFGWISRKFDTNNVKKNVITRYSLCPQKNGAQLKAEMSSHFTSNGTETNRIEFCVTKPTKRQNLCSIPHIMIPIQMIESHANFIRRKFGFRYRRMFRKDRLFDMEFLVCFAFDGICVCFLQFFFFFLGFWPFSTYFCPFFLYFSMFKSAPAQCFQFYLYEIIHHINISIWTFQHCCLFWKTNLNNSFFLQTYN